MEAHKKNPFEKIINFNRKIFKGENSKRNILVLILFICAFSFVYYKYFRAITPTTYEYVTVTKKDLKKTVEGSGKVVSVSELDIQQLQSGGKVTTVLVKPGDYVKQGQIIARLDSRQASIQLAQAQASYDKMINGSTKEDLDITKQTLQNSKDSLEQVKKSQDLLVFNAKRVLMNSGLIVRSLYDDKITTNLPTVSGTYICEEETEYKISLNGSSYVGVSGGKSNGAILLTSVPQKIDDCGLYLSFSSSLNWGIGEWVISLPNKISSTYATNLATYNSALLAREQAILNANTSIINSQLSLNLKNAGARSEDIASARASLASAQLGYENTIIRAPFDGQIGAVSAAVGQQTNSQQGIATIITKDKIAEISLNEIDIVNVKLGQAVDLKFDAIPDEVFKGSVAEINTVGLATSNVVSFAVKISIPNADERVKSGMSVTANIITESKKDILVIPSATIKTEKDKLTSEEKTYVLKKENSKNLKTFIKIGINNDVNTEVLEGVNEGDQVVSKTIDSSSATAKTTSTFSLFGSARPGGATGTGGGNSNRTTTR